MPWGCLRLREEKSYSSMGDITDKYEIGELKEFCELCLARERRTDRLVVCKRFRKKDGRKVRQAARNEILILKMVSHPNILQLIDTFETRREFYIIQELRAKVVLRDFYLSRFENGAITEPCGTPEYLAPEVIARQRYGRPVDCWAVGVILFILLSGNPPFYADTEQESGRGQDRQLFRQILAGEYSFDPPYWDEISPAAKKLVSQLLEVDQDQRITAQEALGHVWIAGNVALEKNLKEGVCAQIEKNFAKAKWRKAIRVTTFMQRLRALEPGAHPPAPGPIPNLALSPPLPPGQDQPMGLGCACPSIQASCMFYEDAILIQKSQAAPHPLCTPGISREPGYNKINRDSVSGSFYSHFFLCWSSKGGRVGEKDLTARSHSPPGAENRT
uniref:Protein kinase domain-containing protein n=1 Tax=Gopherus evgoodei TaxID=1825980 RepID=A0A8C4YS07_9SAUR